MSIIVGFGSKSKFLQVLYVHQWDPSAHWPWHRQAQLAAQRQCRRTPDSYRLPSASAGAGPISPNILFLQELSF
jgi:hypothetical protein